MAKTTKPRATQQKKKAKRAAGQAQATVATRIAAQKMAVLEMLERLPIIQAACKKTGISKATFYRWYQADNEFAALADRAKFEGTQAINELAQSKLIELISQGNLSASIFWLKCRNPEFVEQRHVINELRTGGNVSKEEADTINNTFALFEKVARRTRSKAIIVPDEDTKKKDGRSA